jgi:dTDP-4-amino-4,6-dideoxygalactose transaminase
LGIRHALSYSIPSYAPCWGWPELSATLRCVIGGGIVRGSERQRFAQSIAATLELPYVLPVNRGRCAVEVALRALGVSGEDEVVLPSFICESVLVSVRKTGARPVLADLGEGFHLDPPSIRAKLTSRTRCVIVPHLFGEMAPIGAVEEALRGTGIALIDDAAQGFGCRSGDRSAGSFGDCGIISTGLGKPLEGTAGGALVTRHPELIERARGELHGEESSKVVLRRALAGWVWHRLRQYTLPLKARSDQMFSANEAARVQPRLMSNLDAAIAIRQLRTLRQSVERRRSRASQVIAVLGNAAPNMVSDFSPSCTMLAAAFMTPPGGPEKQSVISALWKLGIEAREGYEPLHRKMNLAPADFPNTESTWQRLVLLPLTRAFDEKQLRGLARLFPGD